MKKNSVKKLAKILVDYSCKVKKGETVLIDSDLPAKPLVLELYRQILLKGAYPMIDWSTEGFAHIYYNNATEEQLRHYPKITEFKHLNTDAFIFIRAPKNRNELRNCDTRKILLRRKILDPLSKIHIKKRWVIFDWPTKTLAKDAGMSFEKFQKFVFSSSLLDWKKETEKMKKVQNLLNKTDKVRIVAKNTDLTMSIKGMHAIIGDGSYNMPDGEVFTAPLKNSLNGFIKFDFPYRFIGRKISGIFLEFRNGKVVRAKAEKNEKFLKQMLATDSGSSYVGELGIGCNYKIDKFTDNTLFDEKIGGTIHLALGFAYPECYKGKNGKKGNKSVIHADIVKDLRDGGKIYFDGKLVEENGKFKI